MANPARKFSKGRRDRRRASTFKVGAPGIVECPQCHEMKRGGYYNGKEVVATEVE